MPLLMLSLNIFVASSGSFYWSWRTLIGALVVFAVVSAAKRRRIGLDDLRSGLRARGTILFRWRSHLIVLVVLTLAALIAGEWLLALLGLAFVAFAGVNYRRERMLFRRLNDKVR